MDISTILEYIKENGSATIAEVCHKYGIGYKEARSFFADLEQKGLAKIEGSGFVYCGKKESDSEDDEDDEDEEEEGNETDIDEYIANLRRRLMKRIMGERSDADDTRAKTPKTPKTPQRLSADVSKRPNAVWPAIKRMRKRRNLRARTTRKTGTKNLFPNSRRGQTEKGIC